MSSHTAVRRTDNSATETWGPLNSCVCEGVCVCVCVQFLNVHQFVELFDHNVRVVWYMSVNCSTEHLSGVEMG